MNDAEGVVDAQLLLEPFAKLGDTVRIEENDGLSDEEIELESDDVREEITLTLLLPEDDLEALVDGVLLVLVRAVIDAPRVTVPLALLKGEEDTLPVLVPDDDTLGDIKVLPVMPIDALRREDIESNTVCDGDKVPVTQADMVGTDEVEIVGVTDLLNCGDRLRKVVIVAFALSVLERVDEAVDVLP